MPRRGRSLGDLGIVRDGALLVHHGRIQAVGPRRQIEPLREARRAEKLDLGGRVVLPGFVDSHTHLIFPSSRANEYEQRISGATYEQITRKGGGIQSTVKALRRASRQELNAGALRFLREFAAHGTTTLEAKSGYGLDGKNEIRSWRFSASFSANSRSTLCPHFSARTCRRPNTASGPMPGSSC